MTAFIPNQPVPFHSTHSPFWSGPSSIQPSGRPSFSLVPKNTPYPLRFPALPPIVAQQQSHEDQSSTQNSTVTSSTGSDYPIPEPKTFYIRPDNIPNIVTASISSAARIYSGALVLGYKAKVAKPQDEEQNTDFENKYLVSKFKLPNGSILEETSTILPHTRPTLPLRLYEYEACPFCRKVREVLTFLDLDAYILPCPRGGKIYRNYVVETGGKAMFPYLEDPNTGFASYESDQIITYLFKTYANGIVPWQWSVKPFANLSSGVGTLLRAGKGGRKVPMSVYPNQPLELWSYEPSPFCKIVREKLTELELPYLLRNTARGSQKREMLKERTGRFQVPYLEDPNTGVKMFESAEIIEYLVKMYGPQAPGATELPPDGMEKGVKL